MSRENSDLRTIAGHHPCSRFARCTGLWRAHTSGRGESHTTGEANPFDRTAAQAFALCVSHHNRVTNRVALFHNDITALILLGKNILTGSRYYVTLDIWICRL